MIDPRDLLIESQIAYIAALEKQVVNYKYMVATQKELIDNYEQAMNKVKEMLPVLIG